MRGDELQGAGQFGFEDSTEPDDLVRNIRVSLAEPSVVADAVERHVTWRGPIPDSPANERLLERLGGARPSEAVVVPMLLRSGVGLVFYGDDFPAGRELGPVEELEWAVLEAGLCMERDLLEERLRAFEHARGHRP